MLKKVLNTIRVHDLINPGDTVVVAVSGGADSVALLDVLCSLKALHLRLIVAHLNHRLRGPESDGDEAFVRGLAVRYGVSIEVKGVDVKELSRLERVSLEEAGRSARYAFFDEVAARYSAKAVILAHHADDQAETVLMRLLRGAATTGLRGMTPKSPGGRYVRPLLSVTRREIEEYLRERALSHRNDSTNTDVNFLRNRVRHELIPYLMSYNPAVTNRLVATSEALAADEELLEFLTDMAFSRYGALDNGRATLAVAGVRQEPRGSRLRLYRRALMTVKGDLARIGFRHLEEIDRLLFSDRPHGALVLPCGVRAARSYGEMAFIRASEAESFAPYELLLEGPGVYLLPGGGVLTVEEADMPDGWGNIPASMAFFDSDETSFPWLVRTFRPGDRLSPFGMGGTKKVKDIFIDEKIPRELRRRIPLIFSREKLLWICGVRAAAAGKLTNRTRTVLRAEIHGISP